MRQILVIGLLATATVVLAGPAPWYRWQNPNDPIIICAQLSPGAGWVKVQGPFQDSGCRKPGQPG